MESGHILENLTTVILPVLGRNFKFENSWNQKGVVGLTGS